jgi:hypothetical protein
MTTTRTDTLTPTTLALFARQHANLMFDYYVTRALLESGSFGAPEDAAATAAHATAVLFRRSGFALEREVERCGVKLGEYDEDTLRRTAYRNATLQQTDPGTAAELRRRLMDTLVTAAVGEAFGEAESYPRAA